MGGLAGKVVIVTGGSAGIGRATAFALAQRGATVVVADVDHRGKDVVAEIQQGGGEALFVETDVTDEEQVRRMVDATTANYGRLDAAFNNAGIEGVPAPCADGSEANWARTLGVNLTGVWRCMRAEIPAMLASGGGSIVNCSSVAGLVGFASMAAYVASKHGVVGLTKAVALDYAQQGLRINAVCPGVIETEMIDRFTHGDPEVVAGLVEQEPMGRMGAPEEIADAVVWLCSPAASFVTGQAIAVDGGLVAR